MKKDKNEKNKDREEIQIKRNVITPTKSLAEREEEYKKARIKIFGNSNWTKLSYHNAILN